MKDLILSFLHALQEQEQFNAEAEEWQFADGSACGVCTHSAMHVARAFNGTVVGYYSDHNPAALIGETFSHGHDFAVIADRWVVDYWAYRTTELLDVPILDLELAGDRAFALRLYGPRRCWTVV